MSFQFVLAKCPLSGGEYNASDWWFVMSRHKTFTCAEDCLVLISKEKKLLAKYQIFKIQGVKAGEYFNLKDIHLND